jgi:pimeloyl-ACP methyl ester carboxylesterase
MRPLGPTYDLWQEAASIRVPTLIVQGVDDLVPIEMPRELARTISGARLVEIHGAGRFPYIERPRETFRAIDEFLRTM